MKALIFSDLHVHDWTAFSSTDETGVNSRLLDTIKVLYRVAKVAREEVVDCVLFAGDFFHVQKIPAEILSLVGDSLSAIGEVGIPILAIEGNHDQASKSRGLTSVSGIRVPGTWRWLRRDAVEVNGYTIWGTAYGDHEPPEEIPDIALIHRGVSGAVISEYFTSPFDDDLNPLDAGKWAKEYVVSGHYHRPQIVQSDPQILVPGAPLQHTWGDVGQARGFWLMEITDSQKEIRMFPLDGFPQFMKITEENVDDLSKAEGNFVSVEFSEAIPQKDLDEIAADLAKSARGFSIKAEEPKIVRPSGDRIEIQPTEDLETVIRRYAEKVGGEKATDFTREGIRYLRRARV